MFGEICDSGSHNIAVSGVEGSLGSRRLRFQNPALGPFIINANVQRERPLRDSGRWVATVRSVARDNMKVNLSTFLNPQRFPLNHLSGRHDPTAFGRTYNAISPLLLLFSTQILHPQVKQPAMIPPKGPSQKLCETNGRNLARKTVRVTQIENQKRAMKLERKAELRMEPKRV